MILKSRNQLIDLEIGRTKEVTLSLKREDLLHPDYGGNKLRKLKYHYEAFLKSNKEQVLTFGGAWSNHIYASSGFFDDKKIPCIGVVRGEEPKEYSNTLTYAKERNMRMMFISRSDYRKKDEKEFLETLLGNEFNRTYIIPEGGSGDLGDLGCKEILSRDDRHFDLVACPMGTGSTFKGIWESLFAGQKIYGFPALKGGDFFHRELDEHLKKPKTKLTSESYELITNYHFGGYAKVSPELLQFIQDFYRKTSIKLDPIYTGKMMFGLLDLIEKNHFPRGTKILAIHTGGLQGSVGIEKKMNIDLYPNESH